MGFNSLLEPPNGKMNVAVDFCYSNELIKFNHHVIFILARQSAHRQKSVRSACFSLLCKGSGPTQSKRERLGMKKKPLLDKLTSFGVFHVM